MAINWIIPASQDDAETACRKAGAGVGDLLMTCSMVQFSKGILIPMSIHAFVIVSFDGPMAMEQNGMGHAIIKPGLRTGNLRTDPEVCWPIAKAPADWAVAMEIQGGEKP